MDSSLFEVDAAWYSIELQDVPLTPDANLNHHVKTLAALFLSPLPRYLGKLSEAKQNHWIHRLPSQGTIQGFWKGRRKS
jgi:hypothetical protein